MGRKKYVNELFRLLCGFICGLIVTKLVFRDECFSDSYVNDNEEQSLTNNRNLRCKVPRMNPWDPRIMKWVKHPRGIKCAKIQPYMTYIDAKGRLRINKTEAIQLYLADLDFTCTYRTFDRKYGDDDNVFWYSDNLPLTLGPTEIGEDSVEVVCKFIPNETFFYHNVHAFPKVRGEIVFGTPSEEQLNVLFLMIDSVSHSALRRNLPSTYKYTKNVMGIKYFNAFHKIGTDSFPNQMAMFSGLRVYAEEEEMPNELPNGFYYKWHKFDTWPFVWKYFSAKSYATVYNADGASLDIFNYQTSGFRHKFMDYSYYWFWLKCEQLLKERNESSSPYCLFNEPLPKINLDITKAHLKFMPKTLQFIFAEVSETTHNSDNEVERMDEYIRDFWKELYEGNYLNNTFVVLASDHGLRSGDIRRTHIGALEDRLPFYGLWFPPWFYRKYPQIKQNIQENTNVLSSSFDVFETLKDIADSNYEGVQRKFQSRGQSQLYPLPQNRTCKNAGVADRWCTCHNELDVDPKNNMDAKEASLFLVSYMNDLLKDHDECEEIKFTKFNFFRKIEPFNNVDHSNRTHYFVGIETAPNRATFEAYLSMRIINRTMIDWKIKSDIDRTSRFDVFSECMDHWLLRQFCSCKY